MKARRHRGALLGRTTGLTYDGPPPSTLKTRPDVRVEAWTRCGTRSRTTLVNLDREGAQIIMSRTIVGLAAMLLLVTSACGAEPESTDASSSFDGKTITILVPFEPGGTADVPARLMAKILPDFLPGNPDVVVENMPGGGGSVAMMNMERQPADGTTLVSVTAGIMIRALTDEPGHDYPMNDLRIVGAFPGGTVTVTGTDVGTDVAALRKSAEPLSSGSTAVNGRGPATERLAATILGLPIKQVYGYEGGGPIALAMQRGEIDMGSPGELGYLQSYVPAIESGTMAGPIFQSGVLSSEGDAVRSPLVPDAPTVYELQKTLGLPPAPADVTEAFDSMLALATVSASLMVHQDTPDETLAILRQAFKDAGESGDWKTSTEESVGGAMPTLSGDDAEPALRRVFETPQSVLEQAAGG